MKPPELLQNIYWRTGFYSHIIFGGVALLIGWAQFPKRFRTKRIQLHRKIGFVYVVSAIISSLAGIVGGFIASGGIIAQAGFVMLGAIWFYTTLMAFIHIRKKNIAFHEKFMIYSYAICFSAVTLRLWMPFLIAIFGDFVSAYRVVAWLCWIPNLFVAYFIVKRKKQVFNT